MPPACAVPILTAEVEEEQVAALGREAGQCPRLFHVCALEEMDHVSGMFLSFWPSGLSHGCLSRHLIMHGYLVLRSAVPLLQRGVREAAREGRCAPHRGQRRQCAAPSCRQVGVETHLHCTWWGGLHSTVPFRLSGCSNPVDQVDGWVGSTGARDKRVE
jgi:hypothetical protein